MQKKRPGRSANHLRIVRAQGCLVEGCTEPASAHHFGRGGMATKCDDALTVHLCHRHHMAHHSGLELPGGEREWWRKRFEEFARELAEFNEKAF